MHITPTPEGRRRLFTISSKRKAVAAVLGLLVWIQPAAAQAVYRYEGNKFNDVRGTRYSNQDRLTALLWLSSPLPARADCLRVSNLPGFRIVISAGPDTFDSAASAGAAGTFVFDTTQSGDISTWILAADKTDPPIQFRSIGWSSGCVTIGSIDRVRHLGTNERGQIEFYPGTWSIHSPLLVSMLLLEFQSGALPDIGNSFTHQLQAVAYDISTGNGLACADLKSFANHVRAQTGKKLTADQSAHILGQVALIRKGLNCD